MGEEDPIMSDREDARGRNEDEASEAQAIKSKVEIEDLLDFSFVELLVARGRVVINGRSSLACS
jgi:hypothetical protein